MYNHVEIWEAAKNDTASSVTSKINEILNSYGLGNELISIDIKPNDLPKTLVLVTDGTLGIGQKQVIKVPENIFEFPMEMVLSMLAHECYHVAQKTVEPIVYDKNEREFQAYYEGVFPEKYKYLPVCPHWMKKQWANQALRYYNMMPVFSVLQFKYLTEKYRIEEYLKSIEES